MRIRRTLFISGLIAAALLHARASEASKPVLDSSDRYRLTQTQRLGDSGVWVDVPDDRWRGRISVDLGSAQWQPELIELLRHGTIHVLITRNLRRDQEDTAGTWDTWGARDAL